jgi:Tol biopolymer transport system component/DNA-binding winged helix-turn-helix (wHTH) protein
LEKGNGNKNGASSNAHRYVFADFEIDPTNRICLRGGEEVPLTSRVFDILLVFAENPGRLLEKDELIEKVWHGDFVEDGNLTRNISSLRKALGDTGKEHKYIATVQGHGYRFIANVVSAKHHAEQPTGTVVPKSVPIATDNDKSQDKAQIRRGEQIRTQLYRRPWLLSIVGLCLVGAVIAAFRFDGFKPHQKDMLSYERLRQTKLTQDGNVYVSLISPDGQYLAYVALVGNGRALRLRQTTTGSVLELRPPQTGISYWALAFAPDNSFLYYVLKEHNVDYGNLYRIPLLGGEAHKLTPYANGSLTVSPDGRELAFVRIDRQLGTSSIVVVDSEGTNEHIVSSTNLDSMFYSLEWAPDGNSFLYSFKRHEEDREYWYLAEIPATGGAEHRIGEPSNFTILTAKWMPDKSGLIVNAIDETTRKAQLYAVSYPDGAMRRITNDLNSYIGFSMTADGRSIVLPQMNSNRQIWDVSNEDASSAVQISNGTEKHFDSVSWARNEYVVFDEDRNGSFDNYNIYRMRPDGSDLQQLTFGSANNTDPTVSPDGETIVFVSSRSGKSQLWRMSIDGSNLAQLTDLTYDVILPLFSPDGQRVFFSVSIAGKCQIWQVPASGGASSPVIDEDVYRWTVSRDGSHLAYSTYDKQAKAVQTRIHSLQLNKTEHVLNISPETWMEFSNDGKAIYFNTAQDGAQNIWRQSLDGSKPSPVTSFNAEQVFRFAWSPNGKNLACIRHTTTFDAVILRFD